jgi:SAM-dependent methyltransferase
MSGEAMTQARAGSENARIARERAFHNARFEHDDRDAQLKYYDAIGDCFEDYWIRVAELSQDADILEYGCAYGSNLQRLAPLAHSAQGIDISDVAIEAYRRLTPNARTADEHPLLRRDFAELGSTFSVARFRFYGLATLAVVPFRRSAMKRPLFAVTRALDRGLFALPLVKWWAWYALIEVGAVDCQPGRSAAPAPAHSS